MSLANWFDKVRELIVSVSKIHSYGCYHGVLNLKSSYVFVAGHLKMINLEGFCSDKSKDLYDFKKRQDFVDIELLFRSLFSLLTSSFRWPEKDAFLNCILSTCWLWYNEFYFKLRNHPFLLTPMKRLEYADRLYRLMAADPGNNFWKILS
ncbi:PREDICTED: PRUPE_7G190100 [Prunus dulcis]|uniref:PREDICTED: PRUPE_7G190100 n=1 Tax=Prunus dulcis TaxID=3755 RepID=A0A5E4EWN0_PRUDU|nr:PREDICTED: PRUPE_7G190100 [Prunus dulcis]